MLRALLLQVLYSVRSERLLMEELGERQLLSDEHFTVDGTPIEARAAARAPVGR